MDENNGGIFRILSVVKNNYEIGKLFIEYAIVHNIALEVSEKNEKKIEIKG